MDIDDNKIKLSGNPTPSSGTDNNIVLPIRSGQYEDSSNLDFMSNINQRGVKNIYDCELDDVISNYVLYYASGEGHTAKAKRYDLHYFLKFLSSPTNKNVLVRNWTMQATKDFIDIRLNKGEAPSTVSRRLATIKHFGRTLSDRVPGFINPAKEVKAPSFKQDRPQGLTIEVVELLKVSAITIFEEKQHAFPAFRNMVLLELLLGTGLRADEVRLLKRSQLTDDNTWLKNVKTKGKKFRDVYIHEGLSPLLLEYLTISQEHLVHLFPITSSYSNSQWLNFPVFISTRNGVTDDPVSFTLAPKTLWRVISEIGKKATLLSEDEIPNLHPHKLRHAFAHGLLNSSNDIRLVAQALGHSDVRTTMRYTERSKEELKKAIEISQTKRNL